MRKRTGTVDFKDIGATKVLTAEISGIAPAVTTAFHLKLPIVYARKHKPITMPDQVFLTLSPSHTKGRMVELIVSPEYLGRGERVLIIDDFLATGATILGLVRLAETAGSTVIGIGALIEKTFEGGRNALSFLGIPIEALVQITSMENDQIEFAAGLAYMDAIAVIDFGSQYAQLIARRVREAHVYCELFPWSKSREKVLVPGTQGIYSIWRSCISL